MQAQQAKSHSPNTAPTKTAEAPQKAAVSAASASRVPTWASGMNDRIPNGLLLQDADTISGIQAKLAISQPNDPYEQEADHVAEQVMRTPASLATIQRKCACGGIAGPTGECEECAKKRIALQRHATQSSSESTAPPIVNQVLNSGNGQPLDAGTRAFMEPRFGQDFSHVRVHTNGQAAESAQSVNALAYTAGSDVVFGKGKYRPETSEGQGLLAHELTHVVQQSGNLRSALMPKGIETLHSQPILQRVQIQDGNVLPDPIEVTWQGDPFTVNFERSGEDQLVYIIRYTGTNEATGLAVTDKTLRLNLWISPNSKLNTILELKTASTLLFDLYADGSRLMELSDQVTVENVLIPYSTPKKGRTHSFSLRRKNPVLGTGEWAIGWLAVLDPKAQEASLTPTSVGETEGDSARLIYGEKLTYELRVDSDGDKFRDLGLVMWATSYWPAIHGAKDAVKIAKLGIEKISTKQIEYITFDLPQPTTAGALFPLVEQTTDGKRPTKISLITPSDTQWLTIYPPVRTSQDDQYRIEVPGQQLTVKFALLPGAAATSPMVVGNLVSQDISLGAFDDHFRLTVQPTSTTKAVFGISALNRGVPSGSVGADLQINGRVIFRVLEISSSRLAIDLNEDGKPDLEIADQLEGSSEPDVPPEQAYSHYVHITGPAIPSEQTFYFSYRNGRLLGGLANPKDVDLAATSNALAVGGLTQQAALGTFVDELIFYEKRLQAIQRDAAKNGIIDPKTVDAWEKLSETMTKLRIQTQKDTTLQATAVTQAASLYSLLKAETVGKESVTTTAWEGGVVMTSTNPYTGDVTITSILSTTYLGFAARLANEIKESQWDRAFNDYQALSSGLDQWLVDQLAAKKGQKSQEAHEAEQLKDRKSALNEIARYNPIRVNAVLHPDGKYNNEKDYVNEVPLAIYYWKNGDRWYLKDLTNPKQPFDDDVKAVDGESEANAVLRLLKNLDTSDTSYTCEGIIHYDIPESKDKNKPRPALGGQFHVHEHYTWKQFFTHLSLGLAVVGLAISAVATAGTTLAVVGTIALAGSSLSGAAAATIDLVQGAKRGTLDTETVLLDIGQIIAGVAGAGAIVTGRVMISATEAAKQTLLKASTPWAGWAARGAVASDILYVPMLRAKMAGDILTLAVMTEKVASDIQAIEQMPDVPGDPMAKRRAIELTLAQFFVSGGLTALTIKGDIPALKTGRTLFLHFPDDGPPLALTALGKKSVVIDAMAASALTEEARLRAQGSSLKDEFAKTQDKKLQDKIKNEIAIVDHLKSLGDVELRLGDTVVSQVKSGGVVMERVPMTVTHQSSEYQEVLKIVQDAQVGGKGSIKDQTIVADLFFAVTEPGVIPVFKTQDRRVINGLLRMAGKDPHPKITPKNIIDEAMDKGFEVTIVSEITGQARKIFVKPIPRLQGG